MLPIAPFVITAVCHKPPEPRTRPARGRTEKRAPATASLNWHCRPFAAQAVVAQGIWSLRPLLYSVNGTSRRPRGRRRPTSGGGTPQLMHS
jgi:hypothetical protein